MAFLFDFTLAALPVLDDEWAKVASIPGYSVKAFTALTKDAIAVESKAKGPWLNRYSSTGDRGSAFANASMVVRDALRSKYPKCSIEPPMPDGWIPLPDRHLIGTRVLDDAKNGIKNMVAVDIGGKAYHLAYELLIKASCVELTE